jgi:hypothetical protein
MIPGVTANYWLTFLPATIVFGIGLGLTVAPLTTVALGAVPTHLSGLASGVSNAVSRVATMLAIAMLGALMIVQFGFSLDTRTKAIPLAEPDRLILQEEKLQLGGAEAPPGLPSGLRQEVDTTIDQAFVDAFRLMMAICGLMALVSSAISIATISNHVSHLKESKLKRSESGLTTTSSHEFGSF